MENSANLGLPYLEPSQAQKHVTVNEALRMLDAFVQIGVESRSEGAPPAAPAEGARYVVASPASGDWAGQADALAEWVEGVWVFYPPRPGWLVWAAEIAALAVWDGSAWVEPRPEITQAPLFGVNTAADAVNRLAVKSDAVLLSHDDVTPGSGDVRLVLNKGTAGNTGSVTFQSNWSGRAEFGLTGDDDWHVKVSADGANWHEALVVAGATGAVQLGGALSVAGPAGLGAFSVTALPDASAAGPGALIYVSDEAGGGVPAFSDGASWRRMTDRALVS